MKKSLKIIIGIFIIVSVVLILFVWNYFSDTRSLPTKKEISNLPEYYQNLVKSCDPNLANHCCWETALMMAKYGYKLAENNQCPDGFQENMLKCIGSYVWCEPIKK